jgi:hypothetical protein
MTALQSHGAAKASVAVRHVETVTDESGLDVTIRVRRETVYRLGGSAPDAKDVPADIRAALRYWLDVPS